MNLRPMNEILFFFIDLLCSVDAHCDKIANFKLYVCKCEFSLSNCHDAVFLNGIHLG